MALKQQDLQLNQQETEFFVCDFVNPDGTQRDLIDIVHGNTVNRKFQLDVRVNVSSDDTIIRLQGDTTDPNLTEIVLSSSIPTAPSPIMDRLTISFSHDITSTVNFDKAYYDLIMYAPDKSYVEILMKGTVILVKTITRLV